MLYKTIMELNNIAVGSARVYNQINYIIFHSFGCKTE